MNQQNDHDKPMSLVRIVPEAALKIFIEKIPVAGNLVSKIIDIQKGYEHENQHKYIEHILEMLTEKVNYIEYQMSVNDKNLLINNHSKSITLVVSGLPVAVNALYEDKIKHTARIVTEGLTDKEKNFALHKKRLDVRRSIR